MSIPCSFKENWSKWSIENAETLNFCFRITNPKKLEWLLENEMIDILKIKLSPVIFGDGLRLFGNSNNEVKLELFDLVKHDHGLNFLTYKIKY